MTTQRQFERDSVAVQFVLFMLLAADAAIIGLDVLAWIFGLKNPALIVSQDGGFGETFQYIKFFWAALIVGRLMLRDNRIALVPWFILFCCLLVDDALQIHETTGRFLAQKIGLFPQLGTTGLGVGEFIFVVGLISIVGPLLVASYRMSGPIMRSIFGHWSILLAALAFFAVGIDALHIWSAEVPILGHAMGILEDGGEMIVASLLVASLLDANVRLSELKRAAA